jgi:hypothetical protein
VKTNRRILLYGNSVILGSIGAGLRRSSGFEVETITAPPGDPHALDAAMPDIVLFDLEASHAEAPFFLLNTHPALVLIGVSPGTNVVRVWNSQQLQEMSMQGLVELIKREAVDRPDAPVESLPGNHTKFMDGTYTNHISGHISGKNGGSI